MSKERNGPVSSALCRDWMDASAWSCRNEELVRLGRGERPFSEPLVTCFNGHAHPLSTVLADSHGWQGAPCPSCVRRGQRQPFCFSSPKLLTFFEGVALEESEVRDESGASANHAAGARVVAAVKDKEGDGGEEEASDGIDIVPGYKTLLWVECPDCSSALGISTKFSVHDLVRAKVFISFHWGVAMGEHFSGPFSGHSRARRVRDKLRKDLDVYTYIGDGFCPPLTPQWRFFLPRRRTASPSSHLQELPFVSQTPRPQHAKRQTATRPLQTRLDPTMMTSVFTRGRLWLPSRPATSLSFFSATHTSTSEICPTSRLLSHEP